MTSVDLTPLLTQLIGGVFSVAAIIIGAWATAFFTRNIKDRQAAAVIEATVKNSLGKLQQAGADLASEEIRQYNPRLPVPEALGPAVQYAVDHAGDEMRRLGITPEAVADKIVREIGLKNIESNLATTASANALVAPPLAPVPERPVVLTQTDVVAQPVG